MKKAQANAVNKSEWIRSQPLTLSAKEVVEKAGKDGISLSLAHVYTERSNAKKKAGKQNGKHAAAPAAAPAVNGNSTVQAKAKASDLDDLRMSFMKLAMRLGTDEAHRLLDRIAPALS